MLSLKRLLAIATCLPALALAQVPAAYRGLPLQTGIWSHMAINDLGQVAGTTVEGRPTVWNRDGSATTLVGDVTGALLFSINNSGTVVGAGTAPWYSNDRVQPLVWYADGGVVRVPLEGQSGEAKGINGRGDIVGSVGDVFAPGGWFGFIHRQEGTLYFDDFHPVAINDAGEVVGSGPLGLQRWRNGQLSQVESMPGAWAFALNSHGWIAGAIVHETDWYATVWLPDQPGNSLGQGIAYDVNDQGMVVGVSHGRAMLWHEGAAYRLDDLWRQEYPGEWELLSAEAINEGGDIAALARNTLTGDAMMVLLLPVPEPAAVWQMLAAMAVLGTLRLKSGRRSA
ncbi:MAG: extracellular repeat protein family [Pseudoduganella sp.]|jgi:hypothetical protein|nr:extracellular repeat protein family [Pseudoduganella sp.]